MTIPDNQEVKRQKKRKLFDFLVEEGYLIKNEKITGNITINFNDGNISTISKFESNLVK